MSLGAIVLAATIASTSRGVVVADRGSIELFDRNLRSSWRVNGVAHATKIVAGSERVAIVDALANEVTVVELANGRASRLRTAETPVDALFVGNVLYVVDRDARMLERFGADGSRTSLALAADPAFIRESNGVLFVYARAEGVVQEVRTSPFRIGRSARTSAFGSDFEVGGGSGYVVLPRPGKIAVVTLSTMKSGGAIDVGAVPVDIAFTSSGTALSARTLAVADPSAKKVWLIEGSQSLTQAVTRGFLRGLLGLGLFGGNSSQFPTGVDRVIARGGRWYAFDSSSGTLYRFTKSKSSPIAKNLAAEEFAVTADGVFIWNDAVRRLQKPTAQ
jgi:hypothetical protein